MQAGFHAREKRRETRRLFLTEEAVLPPPMQKNWAASAK
jgi:hypothetical protein